MSIDSCLNRELEILEEELAEGNIDLAEFNKRSFDLEKEAREYARESREDKY
jgi:hypothetical protein